MASAHGGRASSDRAGLRWARPVGRTQVPSSCCLSPAGRGVGLRLDMLFSAASGRSCVILWPCVVCGTLSVWASAGSGQVKPRPKPVAWVGAAGSSPSALGEPEREAPGKDAKAPA